LLRAAAVQVLAKLPAADTLDLLLQAAADPQAEVRAVALQALGQRPVAQARAALVVALGDPAVGATAAQALAAQGPAAQPDLQAATTADKPLVRRWAIAGLVLLGGTSTTALVAPLLDDPVPAVRKAAAYGLGQLQAREQTTRLGELLARDPDPAVRRSAAQALGRTGGDAAPPALRHGLTDPQRPVVEASLEALARLTPPVAEPWRQAALALVDGDWDRVAQGEEAAADLLLELLARPGRDPRDLERRSQAATLLGRFGDPRAEAPLLELLATEEPTLQAAAAESLGRLGSHRARPALLSLTTAPALAVRAAALEALGRIGDATDLPRLEQALEPAGPPEIHRAVLRGLPGLGPAALALLDEQRRAATDPELRRLAAQGIGRLGLAAGIEPLAALAEDDPAPEVRQEAILALAALGWTPVESKLQLRRLLTALHAPAPKARAAAAEALGLLGDQEARDPLRALLDDPHDEVQSRVCEALGRLGEEPALEPRWLSHWVAVGAWSQVATIGAAALPLLETLLHDRRTDRRVGAIMALGAISHPDVERLLLEALADTLPEVRQAAAGALGQQTPPAALPALAARLGDTPGQPAVALALARYGLLARPLLDTALRQGTTEESRWAARALGASRLAEALPLAQLSLPYLFDAELGPDQLDTLATQMLDGIGGLS